jgi:hypothetical protein
MEDFWLYHGGWFVFFILLFPRLTMLFCTTAVFTPLWLYWVSWFLIPRTTIALLAVEYFGEVNDVLVAGAVILAILEVLCKITYISSISSSD